MGRGRKPKKGKIKEPEFVVLNQYCQVWTGLLKGKPVFSDNIDDAKPLTGVAQFKTLQRISDEKLDQVWI